MKKLSQLFVTFAVAFSAVFSVATVADTTPATATHVVKASSIFDGKSVNEGAANGKDAKGVLDAIYKAANIFAGFVLGVSIIMIIVGGLRYILSNGDQRQAEQGKMILIYSGIGIVIALSAFVIARIFAGLSF